MSIGLFDRVELCTNMAKTVVMVYKPETIDYIKYVKAYGQRMNGEGDPHHVRQLQRVVCEECGAELSESYIDDHLQTQHRRSGRAMDLPSPLTLPTTTE